MSNLPIIQNYSFGRMTIENQTYSSDLIIFPDGTIQDNWFRQQGHFLIQSDIAGLIASDLSIMIIGTGASGRMQVDQQLTVFLKGRNIQTNIFPSKEAARYYNDHINSGKALGACFHLTC